MNDQDTVTLTSSDTPEQIAQALGKTPAKAEPAEREEPTETKEASESQEQGKEGQAKPGKDGFQKRIDKLTKDRSDVRRERDYWRDLAMKNQNQPEKSQKPAVETKAEPTSGRPKQDDFKTHEEYVEALADWRADEKVNARLAERDAKQKEASLKSEMDTKKSAHFKRVDEFKKAHEDYNEVVEDISDFRLSASLERAILESDNGPELIYQFAKNPEELARINALEPGAQGRAIGRFESSFQKSEPVESKEAAEETEEKPSPAKPQPKFSKAPKPMKTVGSKAGNPKTIFDDSMSTDEWIALRNKQKGV